MSFEEKTDDVRASAQSGHFYSCQNAACSNKFFSLTGRLCSGGKRFDWANVIFVAYFILRGRDMHINFLRLLFMVDMICPLMQEHFLRPLSKSKAHQCGEIRVLGCLISQAICLLDLNNFKRFSFWPWMWCFPAMFCHAGPSSLAFLAGRVVISKSRRMDCSFN